MWCCELVTKVGTTVQGEFNTSKHTLQRAYENIMRIPVLNTLSKLVPLTIKLTYQSNIITLPLFHEQVRQSASTVLLFLVSNYYV